MRAHEARNTKQNPRHHNSWGGLNACDVVLIANLLGVHSALIKSLLENFDTSLTSLIFFIEKYGLLKRLRAIIIHKHICSRSRCFDKVCQQLKIFEKVRWRLLFSPRACGMCTGSHISLVKSIWQTEEMSVNTMYKIKIYIPAACIKNGKTVSFKAHGRY